VSLVLFEEVNPGIGLITLNDPTNLNAMSEKMADDFAIAISNARNTGSLRSVILTGAGKSFSAGGHLEMLQGKTKLSGEANRVGMHRFYDSFLDLFTLPCPIIAALSGSAIGAGLCVACACDIRIATSSTKLGFTFTRLGLHPGMGGTFLLPRIVGQARAAELLLTARVIDAEEALRIGLISRVVAVDTLLDEAKKIAAEIRGCGPQATAQLLETLRGDLAHLQSALAREALCQSINYASPEFAEGLKALKEKRSPNFTSLP